MGGKIAIKLKELH